VNDPKKNIKIGSTIAGPNFFPSIALQFVSAFWSDLLLI